MSIFFVCFLFLELINKRRKRDDDRLGVFGRELVVGRERRANLLLVHVAEPPADRNVVPTTDVRSYDPAWAEKHLAAGDTHSLQPRPGRQAAAPRAHLSDVGHRDRLQVLVKDCDILVKPLSRHHRTTSNHPYSLYFYNTVPRLVVKN